MDTALLLRCNGKVILCQLPPPKKVSSMFYRQRSRSVVQTMAVDKHVFEFTVLQ